MPTTSAGQDICGIKREDAEGVPALTIPSDINMASRPVSLRRPRKPEGDLLLRETIHRGANDLQLVVSLLALQSQRARSPEARQTLSDAMERVAVLARARTSLQQQRQETLEAALREVCEALDSQAEPRSILISLEVETKTCRLSQVQITTLALIVNELVTNAIKHAFAADQSGRIRVRVERHDQRNLAIIVDDDGLPLPDLMRRRNGGLGLDLVRRLLASIGGLIILPADGSKRFEIRVPSPQNPHRGDDGLRQTRQKV